MRLASHSCRRGLTHLIRFDPLERNAIRVVAHVQMWQLPPTVLREVAMQHRWSTAAAACEDIRQLSLSPSDLSRRIRCYGAGRVKTRPRTGLVPPPLGRHLFFGPTRGARREYALSEATDGAQVNGGLGAWERCRCPSYNRECRPIRGAQQYSSSGRPGSVCRVGFTTS